MNSAFLYAYCRSGKVSKEKCWDYSRLREAGELDGPVGTLLVAPVAAITVGVGSAATAALVDRLKDRLGGSSSQMLSAVWQQNPIRDHHIFENPDHLWDTVAWSQDKIKEVLINVANNPAARTLMKDTATGGRREVFMQFVEGHLIEVRTFASATGERIIVDGWIKVQ